MWKLGQQAVESVHADFTVRPVVHQLPVEPVPGFEAAKDLLEFLLAGVGGDHLSVAQIGLVNDARADSTT